MDDSKQEKFINIKAAAEVLGVSETTIRRWMVKGLIPHYRFSCNYKFIESELKEFINKHRFVN